MNQPDLNEYISRLKHSSDEDAFHSLIEAGGEAGRSGECGNHGRMLHQSIRLAGRAVRHTKTLSSEFNEVQSRKETVWLWGIKARSLLKTSSKYSL